MRTPSEQMHPACTLWDREENADRGLAVAPHGAVALGAPESWGSARRTPVCWIFNPGR